MNHQVIGQGFICLNRTEETMALLEHHPKAFLLLTQIAIRARWRPGRDTVTKLDQFQARIGDYLKAGLETEAEYRHAKKILLEGGFATFKGTSKGTVATLIDTRVFSIMEAPTTTTATSQQRTNNDQATTKNKETRKQGNTYNQQVEVSREVFLGWAKDQRITARFARDLYQQCKVNDWKDRDGQPIRNPKAYLHRCAAREKAYEPIRATDQKPAEPLKVSDISNDDALALIRDHLKSGCRNVA